MSSRNHMKDEGEWDEIGEADGERHWTIKINDDENLYSWWFSINT